MATLKLKSGREYQWEADLGRVMYLSTEGPINKIVIFRNGAIDMSFHSESLEQIKRDLNNLIAHAKTVLKGKVE